MERSSLSWMDPRLETRETSKYGRGTFASDFIKKGDTVIVQSGRIITDADFDDPEFTPYAYHCFQVEKDAYICPIKLDPEAIDGVFYVNHSCSPTCGFNGQISLVSIRDIAKGEEITFDYCMTDVGTKEEGWIDMACLCGSIDCRKTITGNDWKNSDLQRKYEGYFSRYVQDLINSQAN